MLNVLKNSLVYFELTEDHEYNIGIKEPKDMPHDVVFISGEAVWHETDKPFIFTTRAENREDVPDFWNTAMPAMSKRFVELLEGAGVNTLQKFPAVVKNSEHNREWDDYYAVNILGKIKCADLRRSRYNELFPGNFSFKELAIEAERAKGALLFRLHESPSTIIIHQKVGAFIMENDPDETLKGWDVHDIIQ